MKFLDISIENLPDPLVLYETSSIVCLRLHNDLVTPNLNCSSLAQNVSML